MACPEGETVREHYAHGGRLFGEDLTTPEHLLHSRAEQIRTVLPKAAATITQLVVDNPVQFGMVAASALVLARTAGNIVKPRTPLQALALLAVLEFATPILIRKAMDSGLLKFRIRDENGQLVPLQP